MLNTDKIKAELESVEKLIEITKKTRDDAIKAKTEAETKVQMSKNELKELGITPENAEAEVGKLELEIESLLNEIKSEIPMDLLRELKRIN